MPILNVARMYHSFYRSIIWLKCGRGGMVDARHIKAALRRFDMPILNVARMYQSFYSSVIGFKCGRGGMVDAQR
ncbi:MAG: hypothetical protein CMM93_01025 [Rickettsiales bacterium]|nr:hypothetical protein [Rickettsiales bacterium]|tara:strand:- start:1353 stop:1574 length:222 start_codon:yes stop_codon:yes gene_type:complete